jgi:hypothetical protein
MSESYKQCILEKNKESGVSTQTAAVSRQIAWIPSKFAVVGKLVKLKDENGWRVVSVGKMDLLWPEVNEQSRYHEKLRKEVGL